ncbi:MAG: hypothetical protein AAGU19_15555 [Prolixibacteraceae bacterium]
MNDMNQTTRLESITEKSNVKQIVGQHTLNAFNLLKEALKELGREYTTALTGAVDSNILPVFREKGPFEAEFSIASDLLVFSMHTNVFLFDRGHPVWKIDYIKNNRLNAYCGIIYIYNFLADSFKFNRSQDLGYLIARIFVNRENHFFVEGKRQSGELVKDFEKDFVSKENMKQILDTAIRYAIEFDLLVPPYDQVKIASVDQMMEEIVHAKMATGKRLGFKFNSDDV